MKIAATAPFRLDLTVWTLRRRSLNQIDRWDSDRSAYERAILIDGSPLPMSVKQTGAWKSPEVQVTFDGSLTSTHDDDIMRVIKRLLGLEIDLSGFYSLIEDDPDLGSIADKMMGVKPPRLASNFETLVNGVAGQLLSLEVAMHLLNRLTARFGLAVEGEGAASGARAFPGPEQLAGADPQEMRDLGFSFSKARTIIEASQAVINGEIDLEDLAGLDDAEATKRLTSLWGIGRWTAEYVLLRGDGRLNVFPGDDIGAWNNLKAVLGIKSDLNYNRVRELTDRWQPYAGLIYFHLLLDSLDRAGMLGA